MRREKPKYQQNIAKERISILFSEASIEFKEHPELAHRYMFIARKIGMRYNVHMTSEQRRQLCRKCHKFLVPGANCKVRTNPKTQCVEYACLECGHVNRIGYSKEKTRNKTNG